MTQKLMMIEITRDYFGILVDLNCMSLKPLSN
jgi:hypothetical protein